MSNDTVVSLMAPARAYARVSALARGFFTPACAGCFGEGKKEALFDWTRELTPMDVADFEFPRDPTTGLVQLAVREKSGRRISAYSASDGTLRFFAMLAALLDEEPAGLYFFEEIDNGIHPAQLHLLVDLIERQTRKGTVQVVTTTHSPELLSMVNDNTFQHMSVVCRSEDTEDAVIRPVAELPDIQTVLRRRLGSRASRRAAHCPFRPPVQPSQRRCKNGLN